MGCTFGTHILQLHRGSLPVHVESTVNSKSCNKVSSIQVLPEDVPLKNSLGYQLNAIPPLLNNGPLLKDSDTNTKKDTVVVADSENISAKESISDYHGQANLISGCQTITDEDDDDLEVEEVEQVVTSASSSNDNPLSVEKSSPSEMSHVLLPPISQPQPAAEPSSRMSCITNGNMCRHLPSLSLPCSSGDVKCKNSRRSSPHLEAATLRPNPMTSPLRRQSSDITGDRTRTLFPSINSSSSSRLRKSISCNDSWLKEIPETRDCTTLLTDTPRLPSITEVDVTGEEVSPPFGGVSLNSDKNSVRVVDKKVAAPSQYSIQRRSSWLSYCGDAKRSRLTRDHSLTSSLENPRLPAIPEDLPANTVSSMSSSSSATVATATGEPRNPYEEVLKSVSMLADPSLDLIKAHRAVLDEGSSKMLPPNTDSDVDQSHVSYSSSVDYSGSNYLETMTELLGLKDDNKCGYETFYTGNVTFDPSSPLLVNIVRNSDNKVSTNATDGIDRRKLQGRDNNTIVPIAIPVIHVNETNQVSGNSENAQI